MAIRKPSLSHKEVFHRSRTNIKEPVPQQQTRKAEKPIKKTKPLTKERTGIKTYSIEKEIRMSGRKSVLKKQIFLSAFEPKPSVSKTFKMLIQRHPSDKALQMILRKALTLYEPYILDGSFVRLPHDFDYAISPDGPTIVQTSRVMHVETLQRAREHFDPLNLESDRAFGRMLATAALACFFSSE